MDITPFDYFYRVKKQMLTFAICKYELPREMLSLVYYYLSNLTYDTRVDNLKKYIKLFRAFDKNQPYIQEKVYHDNSLFVIDIHHNPNQPMNPKEYYDKLAPAYNSILDEQINIEIYFQRPFDCERCKKNIATVLCRNCLTAACIICHSLISKCSGDKYKHLRYNKYQ